MYLDHQFDAILIILRRWGQMTKMLLFGWNDNANWDVCMTSGYWHVYLRIFFWKYALLIGYSVLGFLTQCLQGSFADGAIAR